MFKQNKNAATRENGRALVSNVRASRLLYYVCDLIMFFEVRPPIVVNQKDSDAPPKELMNLTSVDALCVARVVLSAAQFAEMRDVVINFPDFEKELRDAQEKPQR